MVESADKAVLRTGLARAQCLGGFAFSVSAGGTVPCCGESVGESGH